jgi:hypothetical protein
VPNVSYCPKDNVTREEMASFLARLGGLGSNPPVANALTAMTAGSATTVGGYAPNGLARVTGPSNKIDALVVSSCNTSTPLRSVTIIAPGAGFVLVSGGTTAFYASGTGPADLRVHLSDGQGGTSDGTFAQVSSSAPTDAMALGWVFPVATGSHTFTLEGCNLNSGTSTVRALRLWLTALYVPFGYDGGSTLAP